MAQNVEKRLKKDAYSMVEYQVNRGYVTKEEGYRILKERYRNIEDAIEENMDFKFLQLGQTYEED
jgi:hypothetical protein